MTIMEHISIERIIEVEQLEFYYKHGMVAKHTLILDLSPIYSIRPSNYFTPEEVEELLNVNIDIFNDFKDLMDSIMLEELLRYVILASINYKNDKSQAYSYFKSKDFLDYILVTTSEILSEQCCVTSHINEDNINTVLLSKLGDYMCLIYNILNKLTNNMLLQDNIITADENDYLAYTNTLDNYYMLVVDTISISEPNNIEAVLELYVKQGVRNG